MAWTGNDLLRMMQTNHKIFGKEILQIKDATDEWLIKYFKSTLLGLLDYRAKASCKLFNVEASRFGGIESITPKRIDLTKEQCAEIGNHLLTGIVMRDMYSGQPKINKWDSEIILNYIEKGYSFMSSYKLVKSQLWCDYGTPKERGSDNPKITCLNCEHLMFSDMYGECNKQLRIVNPSDTCEYAEPKERGGEK